MSEADPAKAETSYDDTPTGLQQRWLLELNAAKDALRDFQNEGEKVDDEFRGKGGGSRLSLFYSDVQTKSATLSGTPRVRARRRYADALDDVARVSATIIDRHLNADIKRRGDGYRRALALAKEDWLIPGAGQVRLRYVVETEPTETPDPDTGEVVKGERKRFEDVETDHVCWDDFLWTPARKWEDVHAIFYRLELPQDEWERQFPGKAFHPKQKEKDESFRQAFGRAEVWEIWDKTTRRVHFLSEQHQAILRTDEDPYGLPGFFPSPRPLLANTTTRKLVPKSSYFLAKGQYDEAHELQRRIRGLVKQVKVAFAYDAANEGLQDLLDDAEDGIAVPVKNWAAFMQNGGVAGGMAFIPNKDTVDAILALSNRLAMVKREIYEITGQSDIMRGQAAEKATATEQRIKARFGSSRIQADQDEFARFASEAQQIRAHLVARLFDPETIVQRSNIRDAEKVTTPEGQRVPNDELIGKAVELLKSDVAAYEIDVDSDSVGMTDFDSLRQERVEGLGALGQYFQQAVPFVQFAGAAGPEMAKAATKLVISNARWLLAGMKGSEALESEFDRFSSAVDQAAQQPPPPPQPDPKVEAAKVGLETKKVEAQAKVQGAQVEMAKSQMEMQQAQQKHAMDMQKMGAQQAVDRASFGERMAEIQSRKAMEEDTGMPVTEGVPA